MQTLQWVRHPIAYMERAAARYGGMFTSRLVGFPPLVHLSDPEAIREVFTATPAVMCAGKANAVLAPVLGAHSLLLLDGGAHLRHRRMLLPAFHGPRVLAHGEAICAITERAVRAWPRGCSFALLPQTRRIALDVMVESVLGVRDARDAGAMSDELEALLGVVSTSALLLLPRAQVDLGLFSPWGRITRRLASIDRWLYALIASRRAQADEPAASPSDDVLTLLCDARDEDGRMWSDRELRDELMTLLVAGHETVATALAWTFHHLTGHPTDLARACDELDDGGAATRERPWLDAVVRESLRLTPVLPIVARTLTEDTRVGGVMIPRGTRAAPNVYLAHRSPEHWTDPTRFNPARFLGARPSPYAFFPFGGGARRCIGMTLALFEMRTVLATVLRRVRVLPAPGSRVHIERHGVTLAPSGGMPVVVVDR